MAANNNDLPVDAIWIKAKKGGGRILLDPNGFRLRFKKEENGRKYFVCTKKDVCLCPVKVSLDVNEDKIVRVTGEHTHDNDLVKEMVDKVVCEKVNEAVSNPTVSPRTVFQNITSHILNNPDTSTGLPYLPKQKSLARELQKKRKLVQNCPPVPKEWEEMVLPDHIKETIDGQNFLILDTVIPGKDDKILGFASPTQLQVMSNASDLFGDGTFEMVKQTLFHQCWVIVVKMANGLSVPTAFFLLPNKEAISYNIILQCLKEDHNIEAPSNFHLDYEASAIKSVRSIFPSSNIVCCDTHWKRALRMNMQKCGLLTYYNEDPQVQTFIRKLWTLSLVPISDIVKCWELLEKMIPVGDDEEMDEEVAQDFNHAMEHFMLYFEQTWIGSLNKRTKIRGKPRFSFDSWNKYNEVLAEDEITTNVSEAWNSVVKMTLPMKPSIWTVIEQFRKEEALARQKILGSAGGNVTVPNTGRRAKVAERRVKMKGAVTQYTSLSFDDYLVIIIAFYNDY